MNRRNICIVTVAGGIALIGGAAAAVALPGAASPTATEHVPVSTPAPDDHAGTHPDGGNSGTAGVAASSGVGAAISQLATTTDSTGVDKGAEISAAASDGQSQAAAADTLTEGSAPVETPNPGGTGTADQASGGASAIGTGIADDASGGRSAAGSGNAETGLSHNP